jgi:hypothetical protein
MTTRDDVRKLHATRFVEHFVGQDDAAVAGLRKFECATLSRLVARHRDPIRHQRDQRADGHSVAAHHEIL